MTEARRLDSSLSRAPVLRATWPVLAGIALLTVGTGLQNSLLGLRATAEGYPIAVTGGIMTAFYVGYVLGSVTAPGLVRAVGHVRVFSAFASVAAVVVLLHGQFPDAPLLWGALRFVSGICLAGLFIVAESWLNASASNRNRGRILSLYGTVMLGGMAGGQLLLNVSDPAGFALFVLASALMSLSLVPVSLSPAAGPVVPTWRHASVRDLVGRVPLGVAGCLVSGAVQGMLLTMGAVYGRAAGYSVAQISALLAVAIVAGMLLQLPLGGLSDRLDRRVVIAGGSAVAAVGATGGALLTGVFDVAFLAAIAVVGGFSLPLYSLIIAHVNDYLEAEERLAASSTLAMLTGIGLAVGPVVAAVAIGLGDAPGFLWVIAGSLAVLAVYSASRTVSRPSVHRGRYVPVPARAATLATAAFRSIERRVR